MSRSGYTDDLDQGTLNLYRGLVKRVIRSKRGQAFLREVAVAMDAMPEKALIVSELIDSRGQCCTIGVVCKSRGVDVVGIDVDEPEQVAKAVGISKQMAAEIEYENDEGCWGNESPEERWQRMRRWIEKQIVKPQQPQPQEK